MNQVLPATIEFETCRNDDAVRNRETALVLRPDTAHLFFVHGRGATLVQGQTPLRLQGGSMAVAGQGNTLLPCMLQASTSLLILRLDHGLLSEFPALAQNELRLLPLLPAMGEAIGSLLSDAPFPGIAGQYFQQAKLLELLAFSLQCLGCPLRNQSQRSGQDCLVVQKARDIIEADVAGVPPLADLARELGTNETRLNACFRNVLGCTPYDFIKEKRLEKARKLVAETGIAMGTIAERVGYTSQAHFSVVFQKEIGMSPRDYRKQHQGSSVLLGERAGGLQAKTTQGLIRQAPHRGLPRPAR